MGGLRCGVLSFVVLSCAVDNFLLFEAFVLPQWFLVCLLLATVSSTCAALKPFLMCKRDVA